MRKPLLIIPVLMLLFACSSENGPGLGPPERTIDADKKYAGVFKALDGVWEGSFYIYEDPQGQKQGDAEPKIDPDFDPARKGCTLVQTIRVRQNYHSESPYYQKVTIKDIYTSAGGREKVEESYGINKIENGKMWCVVQKPDEIIIHEGIKEGGDTIIWSRKIYSPLKIETFKETVSDDKYSITGWGYYRSDDPELSPKTWFKGEYIRVK